MRQLCLSIAMIGFLTAPAGAAAEKPTPIPQRPIARIDSLFATLSKGEVVIQAKGAVDSGGWRQAKLRPVKRTAADAKTIVVEFVATPPASTQAVIQGLLPVAAATTLRMRRGVVSVRVTSGSNEITTQILN
jgi:hypothetical protein